ncbi:GNAT family N-acetyltransferase [Nitrobacter sp. Nb-311A]|uniref:GNAT family N-acetyltransferase n=1 Tax=Nitrobacter sp. Nb-311A TaxID=314253 RepID=UPI0009FC7BE6
MRPTVRTDGFIRGTHPEDARSFLEDGCVVGVGVLFAKNNELRACYVTPAASRKGVASALIRELEQEARKQNLTVLDVDSSVTAEPFYAAHGYEVREHCEHILSNRQPMACVRMRKNLK